MRRVRVVGIFQESRRHYELDLQNDLIFKDMKDYPNLSKSELIINGCGSDRSLGENPFGRIIISDIETSPVGADSGEFGLKIYKDEDLEILLA